MSDLISRQAVLDYPIRLDHYDEEHGNRHFVLGIESVMEYVEHLPSADRPAGKWVKEDEYGDFWVCDHCGFASEHRDNFCPICGARMTGGEDSEV